MSFSVLTLNLWNASGPLAVRYSALANGLRILRPDIVCLQEVSFDPGLARSQSEIVAEYCNVEHRAEKDSLSILSRYPVVRSDSAALPEFPHDEPRQVLFAEILIERQSILVANTHLAYRSEMGQERKAQVDALLAAIKGFWQKGAAAKILCGDFNDVPDSPAVRRLLDGGEGFYDTYDKCHPGSPGFTYSRKNPYVDPIATIDQRIDYIFAGGGVVPKDCSVVFDGSNGFDFATDHFGVLAVLDLA